MFHSKKLVIGSLRTFVALIFGLLSATCGANVLPQPGHWVYQIDTDLSTIPEEAQINFPERDHEACLSAADFQTPKAFGLFLTPETKERCQHSNYVLANGKLSYSISCDNGATLTGEAEGSYTATQAKYVLTTRPRPIARGVETVIQRFTARRLRACKN